MEKRRKKSNLSKSFRIRLSGQDFPVAKFSLTRGIPSQQAKLKTGEVQSASSEHQLQQKEQIEIHQESTSNFLGSFYSDLFILCDSLDRAVKILLQA